MVNTGVSREILSTMWPYNLHDALDLELWESTIESKLFNTFDHIEYMLNETKGNDWIIPEYLLAWTPYDKVFRWGLGCWRK